MFRNTTIAALVALAALGACSTPDATPEATPNPATVAPATPATAEVSLADTVWAEAKSNFPGGTISTGSPLSLVTDVEDMGAGTIRVYVQEHLSDDERDTMARHTFNMGAYNNTDLTVVVVRDASGTDSNHYRR